MKLYATLETSRGKTVSVSDNETITATVYDGNMKAYSVIIDWCDVGDGQMGAFVTTREWRNREKTNDKKVFYGEEPSKTDTKKEFEDREEDNKQKIQS
jgi:hypothetical protein